MAVATETDRVEKAKSLLAEKGLDALIAAPGSDMAYLLGYFGHPSERPALLIIRSDGPHQVLIAAFESLALPRLPADVNMTTYSETQNAFDVLSDVAGDYASTIRSVAVSDQIWGSVLLKLQDLFTNATMEAASGYLRDLRMRKEPEEVSLLKAAAKRADSALAQVLEAGLQGDSEASIASRLGRPMQDGGLTDTWAIVASGPNGASPHHHSGERVVSTGDAVVLDLGGAFHGYQADMTRTVFVESATAEERAVYEVVRAAQEAAVQAARPGASCQSVDHAARSVIAEAGYGEQFIHRTGHGIGLDIHEDPYIVEGNDLLLEPGMAHSVEPGIYLDGRFGVRIEDIVAITETGAERLNHVSRELRIVG